MALAHPVQQHLTPPSPAPRLRLGQRRAGSVEQTPRLSIVIVNYHLWKETAELVRQLLAAECTRRGDVEIVVVDNHSPRNPIASRMRRWAGVSLRRWGRNRGFARAVNEGIRLSRGQWLLLLNPDIRVDETFLAGVLRLTERLSAEQPDAGIVGFQLRNGDGTRQLSSGPFPTLSQALLRLALPRTRRKYHFISAQRRRRVPWVTGCCLLARRACLEQLGGLDRDYFLYYEDVDLCRRAQVKGWTVWYEPALRAVHFHPLHSREVSPQLRVLTRHALLTYASKHWPRWHLRLLSGLIALEGRLRSYWAARKGDASGAALFGHLQRIALDLGNRQPARARRRVHQLIWREERRRGA